MCTNASCVRVALDALRLQAIQNWAATVQRVFHSDAAIVDLARIEACRRYIELEQHAHLQLPATLEEVRAIIDIWVLWQALELQGTCQNGMIDPESMHHFLQALEQLLRRLTADEAEKEFIL